MLCLTPMWLKSHWTYFRKFGWEWTNFNGRRAIFLEQDSLEAIMDSLDIFGQAW